MAHHQVVAGGSTEDYIVRLISAREGLRRNAERSLNLATAEVSRLTREIQQDSRLPRNHPNKLSDAALNIKKSQLEREKMEVRTLTSVREECRRKVRELNESLRRLRASRAGGSGASGATSSRRARP